MQIAIIGAGRIGSAFALRLARAGHDVTLVARGKRLEELQRDPAIVDVTGARTAVKAGSELDPVTPWALVLVTVLAHQVDPVLPSLTACAAKKVMFMFNTVEPLTRLRDAVGAGRFEFGFPTVIASFVDGKLKSTVDGPGNVTTVTSQEWAKVFTAAKIPTVVHPDMESFLRSHAAFVIPLMAMGCRVHARAAGVTWAEARGLARAYAEAFAVVRQLGNPLTPGFVVVLSRMPAWLMTGLLWVLSRSAPIRDLGAMGPAEVRALIDGLKAAAPGSTSQLLAIRP